LSAYVSHEGYSVERMTKSILIVDDHTLFASAMQFLLQALDADFATRTASSVNTALGMLGKHRFDLLLLDYSMPSLDGLAGFEVIRNMDADLPIAFLSGVNDARVVARALDLGAIGWLPKTIAGQPLLHALHLMLNGERFVPPDLLRSTPAIPLSGREMEVAELLADGFADKEIAERLGLQLNTIKVHVKALLKKYNTDNRTRFALAYRRA
jgi:two-component system nitrate/nitrite response regulator NarL